MNEQEIFQDYQDALNSEYKKQEENTDAILLVLSKKVEANYIEAIKKWLSDEDNGIYGNLKIVDAPIGEWQDECNEYDDNDYWGVLKGMYVNQSCGYFGDDYYGTLEIKISESEYLRASFSL
jgi:hypothetical protein